MFIHFHSFQVAVFDQFGKFLGLKLGISQSPGDRSLELKSFGEAPAEDLFLGKMPRDIPTCRRRQMSKNCLLICTNITDIITLVPRLRGYGPNTRSSCSNMVTRKSWWLKFFFSKEQLFNVANTSTAHGTKHVCYFNRMNQLV